MLRTLPEAVSAIQGDMNHKLAPKVLDGEALVVVCGPPTLDLNARGFAGLCVHGNKIVTREVDVCLEAGNAFDE